MASNARNDARADSLRIPPQSVEAEQAVIGGVLLSPEALARVGDLLREEDFYRRDHRLLWRAILHLAAKNRPFDAVTLGEWLESKGLQDQAGGTGYLIELASSTPSAANVRAYAEIVHEKALCRALIEQGTDIVCSGFEPDGREAEFLIAEAQRRLSDLSRGSAASGPEPIRPILKAMFRDLQDRWESGDTMTGLSTPWEGLNEQTFGIPDGDLVILAARPSMGKTIAGEMVVSHCGEFEGPALAFSLEMSKRQLVGRQVARVGRIPHTWIRSPGRFPDQDWWAGVNMAMGSLSKLQLEIDDTRGLRVEQIVARSRNHAQKLRALGKKLRLVLVDHLHIVEIPGINPARELGEVTRQLKNLAGELECPVIALAQLNRSNTARVDKRPTLADLRESGAIEQNADDVWFLHREDYYDRKSPKKGLVELIIGKARNAPAGGTVYLRNAYQEMRLEDWTGPLPFGDEDEPERPREKRKTWTAAGADRQLGGDR